MRASNRRARTVIRSGLAPALAFLIGTQAGTAQSTPGPRSAFAFTPIPGLNANAVQHRGKILFAQASNTVHVFSAATRTFTSLPIGIGATIRFANDWLCVFDGQHLHAFGAQTGEFRTLPVGPGAVVVNPPNQNNDGVLLVRDGNDLHAFSGFSGEWTTRTVSPAAQVFVQRDTAVCIDGPLLLGRSSFEDLWIPAPQSLGGGGTNVQVDGNLAIVDDGQSLFAFSALLDRWCQTPRPAGLGTLALSKNVAVWPTAEGALGVSAFGTSFASFDRPGLVVQVAEDQCAVLTEPSGKACVFAGGPNTFVDLPGSTTGTAVVDETFALFPVASGLVAISGIDGSIASFVMPGIGSIRSAATTAAITDPLGEPRALYSSLGPGFVPVDVLSAQATATRSAIVLTVPGKTTSLVFDARSGAITETSTPSPRLDGDARSSLLVLGDGNDARVFDPERDRILEVDFGGPLTRSAFWRTTWIGHSGPVVTGFGALHGRVVQFDRGSSPIELRASSEVGAAIYPDGLLGFASISEVDSPAQFPEFRRALPRGTTFDLQIHGTIGSAALLFLAAGPTLVDDTTTIPMLAPGAIPLGTVDLSVLDRSTVRLTIPVQPTLQGLTLEARALWVDASTPGLIPGDPTRIRIH